MTELFESVSVDIILEHRHDDGSCPFCRTNEEEKPENPVSSADSDWEEDPADAIGNDAGKLEKNMEKMGDPRPTDWTINRSDNRNLNLMLEEGELNIKPNPHHIIPGNESLKEVPDLLDWIFKSDKITGDIGYDVNNYKNGVWLPSNNAMRGHKLYTDKKNEDRKFNKRENENKELKAAGEPEKPAYTKLDTPWEDDKAALPYKKKYCVATMRATGRQFHDRHADYSAFIREVLEKLAQRMNQVDETTCKESKKKSNDGKCEPPYALVARLNGVSDRFRPYLEMRKGPGDPIFTSKLAKAYWPDKK